MHANFLKQVIKMNGFVIAAIVIGVLAVVLAFTGYMVFYEIIDRRAKIPGMLTEKGRREQLVTNPEKFLPDPREEWLNEQIFEDYSIVNADGYKLCGYLLKSERPSDIYVFCSHGYRCWGKREFRLIAKFYHDLGYNVFLVDHQAHGDSEGKYVGFGALESRDAMQWLDFLIDSFGSDIKIILHGISMGCATVTLMSGKKELPENVKFTVADCGYTSPWNEFAYHMKSSHAPTFPLLDVANLFNRMIAKYDFKKTDSLESVRHAQLPMLFVHGSKDAFVPTYMVNELYEACTSEKELLIVDGAAHAESYMIDSQTYEEKVKGFIDRYLKVSEKV